MNTPSFPIILLSGSLAFGLACLDVGEIHNPAANTPPQAGAGGAPQSAGGSPQSAGSAGAGGNGAASGGGIFDVGITESNCPGCARLSVPLAAAGTGTTFLTTFDPADLTGTSISVRVCTLTGSSGTLGLFAQDGASIPGGQQLDQSLGAVSTCAAGFETMTLDLTPTPGTFDPAQTVSIGLTVTAEAPGPWDNPTVLLVDSVRLANMSIGPWTFDSGVSPFQISGREPVSGSTLTWVGPDCPGCAALSAPLTGPLQSTGFAIDLGTPVDLTNATVSFRLCTLLGTFDSYVEPYAENAQVPAKYPWDQHSLTTITSCLFGFQYLDVTLRAISGFDPTQISSLGLRIGSGSVGPWSDPAIVLVDSIQVSSGAAGPWRFDLGASPFAVDATGPIPDSAVTWFGPQLPTADGGTTGPGGQTTSAGGTTGPAGQTGVAGIGGTTGAGGATDVTGAAGMSGTTGAGGATGVTGAAGAT
jgi:hypothetical protein